MKIIFLYICITLYIVSVTCFIDDITAQQEKTANQLQTITSTYKQYVDTFNDKYIDNEESDVFFEASFECNVQKVRFAALYKECNDNYTISTLLHTPNGTTTNLTRLDGYCSQCAKDLSKEIIKLGLLCREEAEDFHNYLKLVNLPCIKNNDAYCLPKVQLISTIVGDKNITSLRTKLNVMCTPCIKKYFIAFSRHVKDPVELLKWTVFDLICMKKKTKFCALQVMLLDNKHPESQALTDVEKVRIGCSRCVKAYLLKWSLFEKLDGDAVKAKELASNIGQICVRRSNGTLCHDYVPRWKKLGAEWKEKCDGQLGPVCPTECSEMLQNFTSSLGCCSTSLYMFGKRDREERKEIYKNLGILNAHCDAGFGISCRIRKVMRFKMRVRNILLAWYRINKEKVTRNALQDLLADMGLREEDAQIVGSTEIGTGDSATIEVEIEVYADEDFQDVETEFEESVQNDELESTFSNIGTPDSQRQAVFSGVQYSGESSVALEEGKSDFGEELLTEGTSDSSRIMVSAFIVLIVGLFL